MGCLNCAGSDGQLADVFYRVVQPESLPRVLQTDKDIQIAIFFLTSLSTILNYMLTQITAESTPDVEYFSGKMEQYEVVY